MNEKKWKTLSRRLAFKTRIAKVYFDHVRLPNGTEIKDYTVVELPSYVKLVPIDKRGRVLLQREYRHAVDRYMWETCGGFIDKGESPVRSARRELEEETGYAGGSFRLIGKISDYGSTSPHTGFIVLARGVSRLKKPHREDTESISKVTAVSVPRLRRMIKRGELENSSAIAALAISGILF